MCCAPGYSFLSADCPANQVAAAADANCAQGALPLTEHAFTAVYRLTRVGATHEGEVDLMRLLL